MNPLTSLFLSSLLGLFGTLTWAFEYKIGDILLQPLDCSMCYLIEEEEKSHFSHLAIIVATEPEVLLAEAYPPKTRLTTLDDLLKRRIRPGKSNALYRLQPSIRATLDRNLFDIFKNDFNNLPYDNAFLWDNFDADQGELLYCSELVTKLLKQAWNIDIPTKPMHFRQNREAWEDYFHGKVPDGKPGNSPEDFIRSGLFEKIAEVPSRVR